MPLTLLELSSPMTFQSHLFTTAASLPTWSCFRHFELTCLPSAARLVGKRAHCKRSGRLHAPALVCLVQHACERHLCTSPCANRDRSAVCSSTKLTSKFMACRFSPAPHDGPASILLRPHFLAVPSFPASINASGWPRSGVVVARTQQSQQCQQLHLFSSLPWCELRLRCTWRCILCH